MFGMRVNNKKSTLLLTFDPSVNRILSIEIRLNFLSKSDCTVKIQLYMHSIPSSEWKRN